MNWHQWHEFAYRNAGIATFLWLVLGSVFGSIYAYKLTRTLQSEVKSFRVELSQIRDALAATTAVMDDAKQITEQGIAGLRGNIDGFAERQVLRDQALINQLKSTTTENEFPIVPQLTEELEALVFPSSVANYLRYVQEKRLAATEAKSDYLHDGNLVPSPEGEFIIVSDESSDHDLAVPQVPRFSSSADFSGYFRDYFECDAPSAGEVWITRPALVRNDDIKGGWQVLKKGALEVRP